MRNLLDMQRSFFEDPEIGACIHIDIDDTTEVRDLIATVLAGISLPADVEIHAYGADALLVQGSGTVLDAGGYDVPAASYILQAGERTVRRVSGDTNDHLAVHRATATAGTLVVTAMKKA